MVLHSVKIYADYGENSLALISILSKGILALYIGRLIIDSLPLSSLNRSPILNWLWKPWFYTTKFVYTAIQMQLPKRSNRRGILQQLVVKKKVLVSIKWNVMYRCKRDQCFKTDGLFLFSKLCDD